MKSPLSTIAVFLIAVSSSCTLMVSGYEEGEEKEEEGGKGNEAGREEPTRISFTTESLFPFRNNSNWWMYSESGGNSLRIAVTDTISDDGITYYRVSFQEHRVDTTDDWFQQSSGGTLFGPALTGTYHRFLPPAISAARDTFTSNGSGVTYTWNESLECNGIDFHNVVSLKYTRPIIHGFDEIILADSIGIVRLVDYDARWTVTYDIDSCSIDGNIRRRGTEW
ncbi:MAG: hypothetical protein JXA18_11310 [Chitinispirillaceae bacterium]|nr:hypothetical protein [Chitinispirillaceae bacterium]